MKCDASLCTKNNIELLKASANILDAFCLLNINSFPYTTDTSLVLNITSSDTLSLIYTIIDAKFTIINNSTLSIGKDKLCAEPPEISVFDKQYEYKIKNNLLKIYSQNKIFHILKIVKIENYQQEKFGKDSYKLTFLVIQ